MALSPAEQAARDQAHFRDFTAARGLNPGPGQGPAPNSYNVTMPAKPSYNTAAWMNSAPGMQAGSFGLNAPTPVTQPSSPFPPSVPEAGSFGPPRPEYPGNTYGPFQRSATHNFSPEAQAWQQGVREPYTAPGGPLPSALDPRQMPPAGLMKNAVLSKPPTAFMRGMQVAGGGLRAAGEVLGPAGTMFAADAASRGLERMTGDRLDPQTAAAMGIPQMPENPAARTPEDIYRNARAANPPGMNTAAAFRPSQNTAENFMAAQAAPEPPRPESASGPVGPTIPSAPLGMPSAATTDTVNRALGGLNPPPDFAGGRQPIAMQPEVGGPSSAEQLAQLQQDEARAEAARVPTRLGLGGLTDGQGVIVGQDGRTFQFDGQKYASFAPDGTLLSQRAAEAGPNAADREAAMQRSAEATKYMDRARAADDYRYNIGRAMEYRDPLQRALMAKAAGDTYQTRVGGIPNAEMQTQLQKQELVNRGGVQQQEVQNQGGLAVAKEHRMTQKEINKMQADSRVRSAEIRAQTSKDLRNQQGEEMIALDVYDPDTGQKTGQKLVPKFQQAQQPQQPPTQDQLRAAALDAYRKAPSKIKEIRQWLMGNKITDHGFLGAQ